MDSEAITTPTPTHSGDKNAIVEQKGGDPPPKPNKTNGKVNNTHGSKPFTGKSKPIKAKSKVQQKLPQHPDTNYARTYQIRFDMRIQLDKVMDECESKVATVAKFREIITKIMDDKSSAVLYPYSTSSSAIPITAITRLPNYFYRS